MLGFPPRLSKENRTRLRFWCNALDACGFRARSPHTRYRCCKCSSTPRVREPSRAHACSIRARLRPSTAPGCSRTENRAVMRITFIAASVCRVRPLHRHSSPAAAASADGLTTPVHEHGREVIVIAQTDRLASPRRTRRSGPLLVGGQQRPLLVRVALPGLGLGPAAACAMVWSTETRL